jgi:hypothetical protein
LYRYAIYQKINIQLHHKKLKKPQTKHFFRVFPGPNTLTIMISLYRSTSLHLRSTSTLVGLHLSVPEILYIPLRVLRTSVLRTGVLFT